MARLLRPITNLVTVAPNDVVLSLVTSFVNVKEIVVLSVTLLVADEVKLNESVVDVLKVSVVLLVLDKMRTVEVVVEDENVIVLEVAVVVKEVVLNRETAVFVNVAVDVSFNVHVDIVHR